MKNQKITQARHDMRMP